jgi:CubicO group peptidase (beta-lactamase class C family)
MLREAGTLNLDDRIAQYLPSFDNPRSRDITVRQLLTHTSGIRGEIYVGTGGTEYRTLREAVDAIGAKGPETPPGTAYFYSDTGTSTLGAVIAERSGMLSEEFIRSRVLEPLRMRDSFLVDEPGRPLRQRVAAAYRRQGKGPWERYWDNTMPPVVSFFRASGGLYATALDYAYFMAAIAGRGSFRDVRLLTPASVSLALQPHSAGVFPTDSLAKMDQFYGFSWFVYTDKFRPVEAPFSPGTFFHGGSDGTLGWADPKRNLIVIYAAQSRFTDTPREFVRLVYDALLR